MKLQIPYYFSKSDKVCITHATTPKQCAKYYHSETKKDPVKYERSKELN